MANALSDKQSILDAIRRTAQILGHPPSRPEFKANTGISDYQVLTHFPNWREAVRAAGLQPDATNLKLNDNQLLEDWGKLVRKLRQIPTRDLYRREGNYSPGSFEKHLGPWSTIPAKFHEFAGDKPEWADVIALLPVVSLKPAAEVIPSATNLPSETSGQIVTRPRHAKLDDRSTYGNPIDFRGLRHEPVNEQGVVFLFGMVAKELGYMVEAVQTGYPDCEAKRQVAGGRWQRERIEFEFESRNFDHPPDGCDIIVCWRHNWPACPERIEVVELSSVIKTLAKSED
jgi:hypothetical protein